MTTITIIPKGPYALSHSSQFLCGFTPSLGAARASGPHARGEAPWTPRDVLSIAFLDEATFEPTVVAVSQRAGEVVLDVKAGARDPSRQLARILSLDYDASPLGAVCERDAIVGNMFAKTPGFRPVCFASPYEAAVWGVLAQRTAMPVAAANKRRLAEALGGRIDVDGESFHASPRPFALLGTKTFPGIGEEKLARLHAVARAALEGALEVERLRAMPSDFALAHLAGIRGVGPWTAEHILVRGAGTVDELPRNEPRVLRAVGEAYGLARTPTHAEFAEITEGWRPFRTWISVRMVTSLSAPGWRGRHRVAQADVPE